MADRSQRDPDHNPSSKDVRRPATPPRNVFLLGGAHDFMIHLAVPDTMALNDFVIEHLSGIPDVASTETSLIFQHVQSHRFD